ncbi:hypothetical protein ACFCWY_33905, partial [Streptomyces sp. NPDC056362]|uniref:hypothetical protein n=1 Tax=Streptomyces sp. NPDC056362 TaxID=3345796 RepID=UPI0035DCC750
MLDSEAQPRMWEACRNGMRVRPARTARSGARRPHPEPGGDRLSLIQNLDVVLRTVTAFALIRSPVK